MLVLLFALFGLIIGSFLNVVILRRGTGRGLEGRSSCMSCAYVLRWYDLVPVASWAVLCGRCRNCGSRISVQYPLVELASAALFAAVGGAALPPLHAAVACAASGLLLAIAVYDLRHTIIPDVWAYAFALCGLFFGFLGGAHAEGIWFFLSGPLAAGPLFFLWAVSGGRWMGLGDAKLALGMGWFLGPAAGLVSVFLAFVIGAVVSVCVLLPLPYLRAFLSFVGITSYAPPGDGFTMKSEVPFGPFLVASFFILWFSSLYAVTLPFLPDALSAALR